MISIFLQKVVFLGLGPVLILIFGLASLIWPFYLNGQLREKLVLRPNSHSLSLWNHTPIPMFIEFYMFNWTNPEASLENHEIPHFVEMGPYVFSEERDKVNLTWNDSNDTVTFKQVRKWIFRPELSAGSLRDTNTNVNVIAMVLGNKIKNIVPKFFYKLVNDIIKLENKVYVTKTVQELLFDGYDDIFLKIAKDLEKFYKKIKIPFDKFGWFYKRNMTVDYDGVFNMMTGSSSLNALGNIAEWNGRNRTQYFDGDCASVRGTTGELWPVNSALMQKASVFATDLCSTLDLAWFEEKEVFDLTGSRFVGDSQVFSNETKCYCKNSKCPPSGIRDISSCRFGAPAFVSFPHFHLADPVFREYVSGLQPSPENHTFDLLLHKTTGVTMGVNARLQINIFVEKIPGLNFFEKLPYAYMPMLWFNERAAITPELSLQLKSVSFAAMWFEPAFLAVTSLGALLLVIGILLWNTGAWKRPSYTAAPLLTEEEPGCSS